MSALLITHNLTYRIDDRTLWEGLNLTFSPGDMVALTGESGCGKTTLLNVLGLLEEPSSGTITYDGQTIASRKGRRLMHRNVMGFMFQNYALVEQWTVNRNLILALRSVGIPSADRSRLIRRALRAVNLTGYGNRPLSGGEQQRVAIARLLIRQSLRIILADEPTAALDADNRAMVMRHLRDFADNGAIVIYTTHNEGDRGPRRPHHRIMIPPATVRTAHRRLRAFDPSAAWNRSPRRL